MGASVLGPKIIGLKRDAGKKKSLIKYYHLFQVEPPSFKVLQFRCFSPSFLDHVLISCCFDSSRHQKALLNNVLELFGHLKELKDRYSITTMEGKNDTPKKISTFKIIKQ